MSPFAITGRSESLDSPLLNGDQRPEVVVKKSPATRAGPIVSVLVTALAMDQPVQSTRN
jgi:hypothetical protein